MQCPCILCFITSLKIKNVQMLEKAICDGVLNRKYKPPADECPYDEVWAYFQSHESICCCLKHACNVGQKFCSCIRCNMLTRIRILCYPKHYNKKKGCRCEVCLLWLPTDMPCAHTNATCQSSTITTDNDDENTPAAEPLLLNECHETDVSSDTSYNSISFQLQQIIENDDATDTSYNDATDTSYSSIPSHLQQIFESDTDDQNYTSTTTTGRPAGN